MSRMTSDETQYTIDEDKYLLVIKVSGDYGIWRRMVEQYLLDTEWIGNIHHQNWLDTATPEVLSSWAIAYWRKSHTWHDLPEDQQECRSEIYAG